jgi:hypothetical protein
MGKGPQQSGTVQVDKPATLQFLQRGPILSGTFSLFCLFRQLHMEADLVHQSIGPRFFRARANKHPEARIIPVTRNCLEGLRHFDAKFDATKLRYPGRPGEFLAKPVSISFHQISKNLFWSFQEKRTRYGK